MSLSSFMCVLKCRAILKTGFWQTKQKFCPPVETTVLSSEVLSADFFDLLTGLVGSTNSDVFVGSSSVSDSESGMYSGSCSSSESLSVSS